MLKYFIIFILVGYSHSAFGQGLGFRLQFSPKLQVFLKSHPSAARVFTNNLDKAFENRSMLLYYYYNKSPEIARASHHYTEKPGEVILRIQENQEPLDELICILFEGLNSRNESKFKEIVEQVRKGTISKNEFALSIVKLEFGPTLATRDLLMGLDFSEKETRRSYFYPKLKMSPDNFEEYLKYRPNAKRNPIKEYEKDYEELRKAQTTNPQ